MSLGDAGPGGRLAGVRLLVVEDDADTREMIAELASIEGACVTTAAGGRDAFGEFTRQRPDILVSDLWMPGGDGYELIKRIRALAPEAGKLTPAIGLSAGENAASAILAGYHAFLAKPFDIDRLVEIIAEFVPTAREGLTSKPGGPAAAQSAPAAASWTLSGIDANVLLLTLDGHVRSSDMRGMMDAFRVHLDAGSIEVVVDARRLTGFSPAAASFAERAVWERRDRVRSVRYVGGSLLSRLVAGGACAVLGIPITFVEAADFRDGAPGA